MHGGGTRTHAFPIEQPAPLRRLLKLKSLPSMHVSTTILSKYWSTGPGLAVVCQHHPQAGSAVTVKRVQRSHGSTVSVRLLQDNAVVLCRQLGFEDGVMFSIEPETLPADASLAPPWLGGFRCDGTEESVLDCNLPGFGNTVTCGPPQRLFCSPVGATLTCRQQPPHF